jgi:hypothetical protein
VDVAEVRIAKELKESKPRREQNEKKALIGQSMPAVQEGKTEVLKDAVGGFLVGWHANSRLFDTCTSRFAQ